MENPSILKKLKLLTTFSQERQMRMIKERQFRLRLRPSNKLKGCILPA